MLHTPAVGRPLTKKLLTQHILTQSDEDEGYIASPKTASPQVNRNVFTFLKSEEISETRKNERASEDDWSSLEQELNRVLHPESQVLEGDKNVQLTISSMKFPLKTGKTKDLSQISPKVSKGISCQFCAKNGEIRSVVESHMLRHPVTRAIICPVLRRYVCDICGASGDNAHTKFYCPENRARKLAPMAVLLKTTRNNASGKRPRH